MNEVRIGLIGCGGNARGHMRRLGEVETALEIEEAVRKAGLITCVGYQLRYSGAVDLARQPVRPADLIP